IRTLTVTGRGVEAIPTTQTQVRLGVEVQGKTAAEVQQEAARRSSAVVELLRSRQVEKLETAGITLNPIYSYENNQQRLTGYTATNTVS
ncbi:SIMPL domain-containing protein, partial [Microcoleus sp. HI-ES]|nr:SIMPL domain-containing protein [Microcoleus sp. HI-ES]